MDRKTKYLMCAFLSACVVLLWVYEKTTETFTATGFVRVSCENEHLPPIMNHMSRQFSSTGFHSEIIASCTNGHELTRKDICRICVAVSNANWEIVAKGRGDIRLSVVTPSQGISHDVAATCLHVAKQLMEDENASLTKAATGQLSNNVRRAQMRLDQEKQTGTLMSISRAEDNLTNAIASLDKARKTISKNLIQADVVGPFVVRNRGKVVTALHSAAALALALTGCAKSTPEVVLPPLADRGGKHGKYVAWCEFECRRDVAGQGDIQTDIWLVKDHLGRFRNEYTPDALTERFLQSSSRNIDNMALASNAFASCSFSMTTSTVPKVVVAVTSQDSSLAKEATEFVVGSFSKWLDNHNRLAFEKNTARLRVEAEKCRRKGIPVDSKIEEALSEARTRMKVEDFRIGAIGRIQCRRMGELMTNGVYRQTRTN